MENMFNGVGGTKTPEKKKDPLKLEHLKEGVKPIMVCVGIHDKSENSVFKDEFSDNSDIKDVDYLGKPSYLKKNNYLNNGKDSYVISTVDSSIKKSDEMMDCTGLLVAGKDKETGEEISLMSHQDPKHFLLKDNIEQFQSDLRSRLQEIKERSEEGTVDIVIFGGNYFFDKDEENDKEIYKKKYLNSIKFLSKEIVDIFGFEPVIIAGPKSVSGADDVVYENKDRRLYLSRPIVGDRNAEAFLSSEIEEKKKEWNEFLHDEIHEKKRLKFDAFVRDYVGLPRDQLFEKFEEVFGEEFSLTEKERIKELLKAVSLIPDFFEIEEFTSDPIPVYFEFINGLDISSKEKKILRSIVEDGKTGDVDFYVNQEARLGFKVPKVKKGDKERLAKELMDMFNRLISRVPEGSTYGFSFSKD